MRRTTCSSAWPANGGGKSPFPTAHSSVSTTSARLRLGRVVVPAKITSSISPPRRLRALASPIAQRRASATLLLPQPFGPTIPVSPGRISTVAGSGKLLNPAIPSRTKRATMASGGGGGGFHRLDEIGVADGTAGQL